MKKLFLLILLASLGIAVMAQKSEKAAKKVEVPAVVKAAFQNDYPAVKKVKWGADGAGFEAEFVLNTKEVSVVYDNTGHRTEFEMDIEINQLPTAAHDYIIKNYAGYKITEASKITNDKSVVTYEAQVKMGKEAKDVIFDVNGNFIKEDKE